MTLSLSKRKWSKLQQEVWGNVETYTDLIMKGDVQGFLDYFHKNYSGWNYCELIPVNKADIRRELLRLPNRQVVSYKINPIAIQIFKDTAIVHYYYSTEYKDASGRVVSKKGRNTDILINQDNKWLLIADHAGPDLLNMVKMKGSFLCT